MPDENGPAVPEFARRATVSSCQHDPVRAFAPVLTAMPAAGIPLGDVLADSGYAHRDAGAWALPLRAAGAQLVQDLHPHDRGPKGTHDGAIIANGNLYCPATPRTLTEPGPLARDATPEQAAAHDAKTAELARHKLGRLTRDDEDGYHRVACPAAMGKIRCPLRPPSMTLDRDRPEILQPPEHPQACCTQQTLTVPPEVTAKTAQKHDYPSTAHRRSYARRTGAERGFATAKDPATNNISRGWCRLMGLTPLMLFTVTLLIVRNQRILAAWDARQADNARASRRRAPAENPANGAARRSPCSPLPHGRPSPGARHTREQHPPRAPRQRPDTARRRRQHARKPPRAHRKPPRGHEPRTGPAAAAPAQHACRNVSPKCENRPHRNVKTSWGANDRTL